MICNFYERNSTVKIAPREKYYGFPPPARSWPEGFRIFALHHARFIGKRRVISALMIVSGGLGE